GGIPPGAPETGEGHRVPVGTVHPMWSPSLLLGLPLVEAVGGDEAAILGERPPERRLLRHRLQPGIDVDCPGVLGVVGDEAPGHLAEPRSEEHTSELQSRENLVCRLLLEKKKAASLTSRMTLL